MQLLSFFQNLKNVSGCITSLKSTLIRHQSKVCLIHESTYQNAFQKSLQTLKYICISYRTDLAIYPVDLLILLNHFLFRSNILIKFSEWFSIHLPERIPIMCERSFITFEHDEIGSNEFSLCSTN